MLHTFAFSNLILVIILAISEKTSTLKMSSSSPSRFKIVSCWSKAGVGTSIVLDYCNSPTVDADGKQVNQEKVSHPKDKEKGKTKLNRLPKLPRIVLDLGATPCFDDAISSGIVLISHGHIDHIGAIFSHARAYSLSTSQNKPTYYVPTQLVEHLEQARRAMTALDAANDGSGSRKTSLIEMNIVGVQPGDEFVLPIKKHLNGVQLFVRGFGVNHAGCPAVGYIIGSRFTPKLKEEYRNISGKEIRELITSGVPIKSDPLEVLEVAYTGDTCASGIMRENPQSSTTFFRNEESTNNDDRPTAANQSFREEQHVKAQLYKQQAFQCPLILCELTFLEDTKKIRQLSLERGHMHLCDVMPVLKSHEWEEGAKGGSALSHLVLLHLSGRYGAKQALDQISLVVPVKLARRCSVAISALMGKEQSRETWTNLVHSNGCISISDYTASRDLNNNNNNNNNNNTKN